MTKNALLEKWPKKSGICRPPSPPPHSGNARKKTFFFIDVFSNGHLQLQPWLEQHKRRCLSHPGLWSPPGSPRRPSCAKPLPTQVSDFEHDFVDLWPKMLGGSFPLLKAVTGQDRVTFHSRWALRLKPDEILCRGRYGEMEVGLENYNQSTSWFEYWVRFNFNELLWWTDFQIQALIFLSS